MSIIQNSTFPPISAISGHTAWWYCDPGCQGVTNPKFEQSKGPNLFESLKDMIKEIGGTNDEGVWQNLNTLSDIVEATIVGTELDNDPRAAEYVLKVNELVADADMEHEVTKNLIDYYKVLLFSETYNLEWFVIGGE